MKTLDEVLSERALFLFKNTLADLLDLTQWTEENRETRLNETRQISEKIAHEAINFVKELLETNLDGQPVLYWKLMSQFIEAERQLLDSYRSQLDFCTEEEMGTLPVTYSWLNDQIRSRVSEIEKIEVSTEKAINPEGEVEDL